MFNFVKCKCISKEFKSPSTKIDEILTIGNEYWVDLDVKVCIKGNRTFLSVYSEKNVDAYIGSVDSRNIEIESGF